MRSRISALLALAFASLCLTTSAIAATDEEVTASRMRAVEFVKSKQLKDGSWAFKGHEVGITALCTIALIENGVPLTDPTVQKGYNYVKDNSRNLKSTYDLSMAVVLLSRIGDRRDRTQIRSLAVKLVAGQMDSGGWTYTCPQADPEGLREPSRLPAPKAGFGDNSCTQFAVLGLWVASRTGVNIDRTLARVARRFITTQMEDGGWTYSDPRPATTGTAATPAAPQASRNTMTGAGLFCLAVAEANRIREYQKTGKTTSGVVPAGDKPAAGTTPPANTPAAADIPETPPGVSLLQNPIFAKGFKRTGDFVKGVGPGSSRYFLWSVERVGVLLGLEKIGETDWFQKGADGLLKTQKAEGGWPSAHPDPDPDGLSDTSFAMLFLRKANLGSDISRLLEGEKEQRFQILGRTTGDRFDTLEQALTSAKAGDTIRIDGDGPYKIGALDLNKDITIQSGYGYSTILNFELGVDRLGIRKQPTRDVSARSMINVTGGKVTLEGLRIQMEPPTIKGDIPWAAVAVRGGSLRLLNCVVSETNKQGMASVLMASPGQLVVRNCLLIGGRAGVEVVADGKQEVIIDNSVIFSPEGIRLMNDATTKKPADITVRLDHSVIQAKDGVTAPKLVGTAKVELELSVVQAASLATSYLSGSTTKGRTWSGNMNLYDVQQWAGNEGRPNTAVKDIKSWLQFWGNTEKTSYGRIAPFLGLRRLGNFSHDCHPQDWLMDLPTDVNQELVKNRVGVNAFLAGTGISFDQYRETIAYTAWTRGKLQPDLLTANETGATPANK